jgi:hypothetical protein
MRLMQAAQFAPYHHLPPPPNNKIIKFENIISLDAGV